jgi:hypothetical protein
MIVATYKYSEAPGYKEMKRSVEMHGHELAVLDVSGPHPDEINRKLLDLYRRASTGHETFLYLDSADSFVQREITGIPNDHILYSTEKNCYPIPEYRDKHPKTDSPWRYLNGGGVCGRLDLMIEYYERYNLCNVGSKNGQQYLQEQFFEATKDGFPVKLDVGCEIFQTIAFADDSEFEWRETFFNDADKQEMLYNKITGTIPAVLHGNGLTEMKHIYARFKK